MLTKTDNINNKFSVLVNNKRWSQAKMFLRVSEQR
jgi:hypothetical protein